MRKTITTVTCDRCGAKINDNIFGQIEYASADKTRRYINFSHVYDLCGECTQEFRMFLNGRKENDE